MELALLIYLFLDWTETKPEGLQIQVWIWTVWVFPLEPLSGVPVPGGIVHFSWPTQGGACNHSVLPSLTANSSHFSVLAEIGWRAEFLPVDHSLSEFEFDVIIGADGRRNTLEGDDSSWGWEWRDGSGKGCIRKGMENGCKMVGAKAGLGVLSQN